MGKNSKAKRDLKKKKAITNPEKNPLTREIEAMRTLYQK